MYKSLAPFAARLGWRAAALCALCALAAVGAAASTPAGGTMPPGPDSLMTIRPLLPDSTSPVADSLFLVPRERFVYADTRRASLYGDLPLQRTRLDPLRTAIVGGAGLGLIVGFHAAMNEAWWQNAAPFRLKDDWSTVLQVDKAGHAFAGYVISYGAAEALSACGVGWDGATIAGSIAGFGYQMYVEVQDGFSEGWGFSLSDMAADALGAGLYLGQHYSTALQNFTPKYQYVPSAWIDVPRNSTTWIDDYNSSSFWLSANVASLFPAAARAGWPSWLEISLGYAVSIDQGNRERRVLLGLDYNLVKLLPEGGHAWNWIRQTLNFVKLPGPTLELGAHTRFHLAFPFTIRLGDVRL